MYYLKNISIFVVLFALCNAKKSPPLNQFEGPWTIRNASENVLPIIGNCPTMQIEPSQNESTNEGVILFKSTVHSYTVTVVQLDQKIYQIFDDSGSGLIGNVSLLHAEKNIFLITELQTEGQIYYAVLTREDPTTPDAAKKIEKIWKSSKPSKKNTLAPIKNENCSNLIAEENNDDHSNESTSIYPITTESEQKEQRGNSVGSTSTVTVGSSTEQANESSVETTSDRQKPGIEEMKTTPHMDDTAISNASTTPTPITPGLSTTKSSQTSPDKTHTLPRVGGNDITNVTKSHNSAGSNKLFSFNISIGIGLFLIMRTIFV